MTTSETTSVPRTIDEPGNGTLKIFDLPTEADFLNRLPENLPGKHWAGNES